MKPRCYEWLHQQWYSPKLTWVMRLLLPLSKLFQAIVTIRRWAFKQGIFSSVRFPVPVIVVGNITLGGTGKTPLVIGLANFLRSQGYRPGIVSRGYGGVVKQPMRVTPASNPGVVGDEPVLMSMKTPCPVVVCRDRVAAVRYLLEQKSCNIVIADDGLQHYRLQRTLEIAVVDGDRLYGNQQCLPAGPLREPISRLNSVDFVIVTEGRESSAISMTLRPEKLYRLTEPNQSVEVSELKEKVVHAVAGIGHPARFFATLRQLKVRLFEHPFPDHYLYSLKDFDFGENVAVVMTEKDAVKCRCFAKDNFFVLSVVAQWPEVFSENLLKRLAQQSIR